MKDRMMKIFNVEVYGIKESMKASGYPMISTEIPDMFNIETGVQVSADDFKRSVKLGTVPSGTGHDNYLKGIIVQFDITYPVYWSPQFQRYNFADIVSSTSAMHRINKIDLDDSTNKYVSRSANERLKSWIALYNSMISDKKETVEVMLCKYDDFKIVDAAIFNPEDIITLEDDNNRVSKIRELTGVVGEELATFVSNNYNERLETEPSRPENIKVYTKYEVYMKIISNSPQGLLKTMRVSTNYLQLKSIYLQRKHHKLKEDWGYFCDWALSLPYFKEFALKETKAIEKVCNETERVKPYLERIIKNTGKVERYKYDKVEGISNWNSYVLTMVMDMFTLATNRTNDVDVHLLFIPKVDLTEVSCIFVNDCDGKEFALVYPTNLESYKPEDIKIEVIKGYNQSLINGYNLDMVIKTENK